uniref:Uncharacterized protein n=1 Tax=Timspurckia oligopyrenoides TaxID=708627 RepID=A0A7S1EQD4_9RHOD|mmetsp:Transcript_11669/g.21119  ORF Transcript_11669/g.21119 Transcript_11669/m.21119 type:complete len:643 (+) Transcript_11669:32-1960(+)
MSLYLYVSGYPGQHVYSSVLLKEYDCDSKRFYFGCRRNRRVSSYKSGLFDVNLIRFVSGKDDGESSRNGGAFESAWKSAELNLVQAAVRSDSRPTRVERERVVLDSIAEENIDAIDVREEDSKSNSFAYGFDTPFGTEDSEKEEESKSADVIASENKSSVRSQYFGFEDEQVSAESIRSSRSSQRSSLDERNEYLFAEPRKESVEKPVVKTSLNKLGRKKPIRAMDLIRSQERMEYLGREEARQQRARIREERNQMWEERNRLRKLRDEAWQSEQQARFEARKQLDQTYAELAEGETDKSFVKMKDLSKMVREEIRQQEQGPTKEQREQIANLQAEVAADSRKTNEDEEAMPVVKDPFFDESFNFGESRRAAMEADRLTYASFREGLEDAAQEELKKYEDGVAMYNGVVYLPNEKFPDYSKDGGGFFIGDMFDGSSRRQTYGSRGGDRGRSRGRDGFREGMRDRGRGGYQNAYGNRFGTPQGENSQPTASEAFDARAQQAHPRSNSEVEQLLDSLDPVDSDDSDFENEATFGDSARGGRTYRGGRGGGGYEGGFDRDRGNYAGYNRSRGNYRGGGYSENRGEGFRNFDQGRENYGGFNRGRSGGYRGRGGNNAGGYDSSRRGRGRFRSNSYADPDGIDPFAN